MRDIARDADDILDQGPFGVGNRVGRAEYVDGPDFMSIALTGVDRGITAGGKLRGTSSLDILHQRGLIVLQLDNYFRLDLRGNLEGFFWQCNASRVTVLCATLSSPSNFCAAGISLDFSSMSI